MPHARRALLVSLAVPAVLAAGPRAQVATARLLADLNPISYLVEGMRDLVIDDLTASAVARALLIPAALAVATTALALRMLHRRLGAS